MKTTILYHHPEEKGNPDRNCLTAGVKVSCMGIAAELHDALEWGMIAPDPFSPEESKGVLNLFVSGISGEKIFARSPEVDKLGFKHCFTSMPSTLRVRPVRYRTSTELPQMVVQCTREQVRHLIAVYNKLETLGEACTRDCDPPWHPEIWDQEEGVFVSIHWINPTGGRKVLFFDYMHINEGYEYYTHRTGLEENCQYSSTPFGDGSRFVHFNEALDALTDIVSYKAWGVEGVRHFTKAEIQEKLNLRGPYEIITED